LKSIQAALGSLFLLCLLTTLSHGQGTVKGTIYDDSTGETLIGASVVLKGTSTGVTTDIDGNFELKLAQNPPLLLVIKFLGYTDKEITVNNFSEKIRINMGADEVLISEVEIVGSRISEKTKQSPLTVESMDLIGIKESPSGNFYESLGNLKGVDVTSASMGFKILNTRGFNSTSPVRTLQLIDGVDNQSPGLNFSLGNFLGSSDLDVLAVEIIAGASSAYYGPGAFNGVIDMRTKDPFLFPGLTTSIKVGERSMLEGAIRWADVIENKKGEKRFGYKLNLFYMTAYDWEATNMNPVDGSVIDANNFSGYDAVNRYADEVTTGGNGFERDVDTPGLGRVFRTGYEERDIADYDTRNAKANLGLYYKFKKDIQAHYNFNYGNGTTIYQGDNRISLRDVNFFQNKIELKKQDKWFVRVYSTNEDAGNSYDAVLTANIMADAAKGEGTFYKDYGDFYRLNSNQLHDQGMPEQADFNDTKPNFSNFILPDGSVDTEGLGAANLAWNATVLSAQDQWAQDNPGAMGDYNSFIRGLAENTVSNQSQSPYYAPGTARFDSLFNDVTSRLFTEGGSRFYSKSALYHAHAERTSDTRFGKFIYGADGRLYRPNSRGTIFEDTLTFTRERIDGELVKVDSSFNQVTNYQYGVYAGYEKRFIDELLIFKATLRMDKNENFDAVFSPAASLVYQLAEEHVLRGGVSAAVRNPTMADQFLYYDIGRAILVGNLNGFDSLATFESFNFARNQRNFDWEAIEYFNVAPIRPERVRTFELGYRGTIKNKFYVDASYYYSIYRDFIGFNFGLNLPYTPDIGLPTGNFRALRVAANAIETVTTQGLNLGVNYYFAKKYALTTNYSWNKLLSGEDDPIIPAFNTPEHKVNVGVNARDLNTDFRFFRLRNWGFGVNYKWVDGFIFEGSPQFTGFVPSYYMIDAAVNANFKKINTTVKIGASNLTDNRVFTAYGGPFVGRLAYISLVYEWLNR
jgi:outer membrane receptor protein involved in Fe transport